MIASFIRKQTAGALFAAVMAASVAACSDSTDPDDDSSNPILSSAITLPQFQTGITSAARVEISFVNGTGPVAREIEIEPEENEEKIVSRITAINTAAGTITLELGGLVINYGSSTRFRTENNSNAGRTAWEAEVNTALAASTKPSVEVRRTASTPQSPSTATFTATDLRLEDDFDEAKIEAFVDADNFESTATAPAVAVLRVFGMAIQITSSTELFESVDDGSVPSGSIEFEGKVSSVNVTGGTITLVGGTVITVGSVVLDATGDLFTLATVATRVTAGDDVRAEGRGTVTTAGPPMAITATSLKIEVDD